MNFHTHLDYEIRNGVHVPIGAEELEFRLTTIIDDDPESETSVEFKVAGIEDLLGHLEAITRAHQPGLTNWIKQWHMITYGFKVYFTPLPNTVLRYTDLLEAVDDDFDGSDDEYDPEITYTIRPLTPDAGRLMGDAYRYKKHSGA